MPERAIPLEPLLKHTTFIRRADGLAPEALLDHWRQRHAPLLRRVPRLRGLVFNIVDRERSPDAPYDSVIELWLDDSATADPVLAETLAADRAAFMGEDALRFTTREAVVRPVIAQADRRRVKRIGLVGRGPAISQERFLQDWVHEHAPQANRQPGLEGYVLNLLEEEQPPWNGYAELWWTDAAAFEAASLAIRSTVGARLGFFHSHLLLYVHEYEDIPPPGRRAG